MSKRPKSAAIRYPGLYEYRLEHAASSEDIDLAERAREAIIDSVDSLKRSPFICREAGAGPFLRESVIPFGHSGCVALFEIENASTLTILAVRHQLEDDYH